MNRKVLIVIVFILSCHGKPAGKTEVVAATAGAGSATSEGDFPKVEIITDSIAIAAADSAYQALMLPVDSFPAGEQPDPADSTRLLAQFRANNEVRSGDCSIERMFELGGSRFVVFQVSTGTCSYSYLGLVGAAHIVKCVELGQNCDSELSYSSYWYKRYSVHSDTSILIEYVGQRVKDSTLIGKDGWLKGDASLDDVATVTTIRRWTITPSFLLTDKVPPWPRIWKGPRDK
jgi:hypothetical protein